MNQKGFAKIALIIIITALAGAAGYLIVNRQTSFQKPVKEINTFEECAKAGYPVRESYPRQCGTPDGRNFVEKITDAQVSLREGQREGSLLVEKIYPDRVTGLNFLEYPIPFTRGLPITLRLGETASNGCTVRLTLVSIKNKVATFIKKVDLGRPCPICLAKNTLIDTPLGAIAVQNLQEGDEVWTVNSSGARVWAKILKTARTPVPAMHRVIHLVLDDGRELFVSAGHPTADGRFVGGLSTGDFLDGGRVMVTEDIPYQKDFTYDILPSGETGLYWANGILMGSTFLRSQ